jgi:hypothetical protein
MIRQIIIPTQNDVTLHFPDDLVGKEIEVIAFPIYETEPEYMLHKDEPKKTFQQALAFYQRNAVDISKIEKWSREDLYE